MSELEKCTLSVANFVSENAPQILTALQHDTYHTDSSEIADELRQLLKEWKETSEKFLEGDMLNVV